MNNTIKILYISHSPFYNGAEICLLNLVKSIDKNLFEPIVVFPYAGPLHDKMNSLGIKTYISPLERWIRYSFEKPSSKWNLAKRSLMISKIIENENINIVQTNSSVVLEGAVAAKLKSVLHVWHIHEYLKGHFELNSCLPLPFVYEIISILSEKIVCVSDYTKSQFKSLINEEKLTTIYNGVEEFENLSDDNYLNKIIDVKDDVLVSVTVGNLSEAKGFDNLLEAASIVTNKGVNIKFIWIGGGSKNTIKMFKSKIKNLGLKNHVFYIGFRNDIQSILKYSDLAVCPSLQETLSLSILEAMSVGLPVITTDCGGPSECVIDNKTGYVVPVNDPIKLSEKIISMYNNRKEMKNFGENGLKHFSENFNLKVYTEKFEKLYIDLVDKNEKKTVSEKEQKLLDAFIKVYDVISLSHWKELKKRRRPNFL